MSSCSKGPQDTSPMALSPSPPSQFRRRQQCNSPSQPFVFIYLNSECHSISNSSGQQHAQSGQQWSHTKATMSVDQSRVSCCETVFLFLSFERERLFVGLTHSSKCASHFGKVPLRTISCGDDSQSSLLEPVGGWLSVQQFRCEEPHAVQF